MAAFLAQVLTGTAEVTQCCVSTLLLSCHTRPLGSTRAACAHSPWQVGPRALVTLSCLLCLGGNLSLVSTRVRGRAPGTSWPPTALRLRSFLSEKLQRIAHKSYPSEERGAFINHLMFKINCVFRKGDKKKKTQAPHISHMLPNLAGHHKHIQKSLIHPPDCFLLLSLNMTKISI